jgi:hypothetical protein
MDRLQAALSAHSDLACTSGVGLLPLCEQASAAWQELDGRHRLAPSPLAAATIRAMIASMATALLARTGRRLWCEFTSAPPASAKTFLHMYPAARIICAHQACPRFIRSVLANSPWGLSGPGFAPFVAAYPNSTITALTAYWAARTRAFIELESSFPATIHRLRYEDLDTSPDSAIGNVLAFLGLDPNRVATTGLRQPGAGNPSSLPWRTKSLENRFPAGELPPPLLQQVNELLATLDYPPISYFDLKNPPRGGP